MTTAELLERLDGVKRQGDGWLAKCPAHDDRRASLSVTDNAGTLLAHCHAGCTFDAILAAVPAPPKAERVIDATYTYRDAAGVAVFDVVRFRPKDFRQRRADGAWTLDGVTRVPYRLPELLASRKGVAIVEGEKDVDRLASLGIVATCNPGGAGKWRPEYAEHLRGRRVVVIPDNDDAGRSHAADVARSLDGTADVRLLTLDVPPKGDVSDWLDAGHDAAELRALLLAAPPYSFLSATPTPEKNETPALFETSADIMRTTATGVEWVLPGILARGSITELSGKAKASGKTTFATHALRAVFGGVEFLGQPTTRDRAVYLSEQPQASLAQAIGRAGLATSTDVDWLRRAKVHGWKWPDVARLALDRCDALGARILIVDTLPQFAGLRGDAENDSGAALEALEPLQAGADAGLAVWVLRHDRKGGGDVGESARGSSAFTGAVDIVLQLARMDANPSRRMLRGLSRFDETPAELVIDLTDAGYVALGSQQAVEVAAAKTKIGDELAGGERTVSQLVDATTLSEPTIRRALKDLVSDGSVVAGPEGKKGSPQRFRLPSDGSFSPPYKGEKGNLPVAEEFPPFTPRPPLTVADEMEQIFGGVDR